LSNFCTEASDSPSFCRVVEVALPQRVQNICFARCLRLPSESPVAALMASRETMYSPPELLIEPVSIALIPSRRQTSRVDALFWGPTHQLERFAKLLVGHHI